MSYQDSKRKYKHGGTSYLIKWDSDIDFVDRNLDRKRPELITFYMYIKTIGSDRELFGYVEINKKSQTLQVFQFDYDEREYTDYSRGPSKFLYRSMGEMLSSKASAEAAARIFDTVCRGNEDDYSHKYRNKHND